MEAAAREATFQLVGAVAARGQRAPAALQCFLHAAMLRSVHSCVHQHLLPLLSLLSLPSSSSSHTHSRTPESLGATDVERTYCRAAGSYRRGEPESGDIDILVSPPPSLARTPAVALLAQVCVCRGGAWVWAGLPSNEGLAWRS